MPAPCKWRWMRAWMPCTFTLGLLPQMHRWEADVDANVAELLAALG